MQGHKCTTTGLWMVNLRGWEEARPIEQTHLPAIESIAKSLPTALPNIPLQDSLQRAASALQVLMETTGPKERIYNLMATSTPAEIALFYHQVLS